MIVRSRTTRLTTFKSARDSSVDFDNINNIDKVPRVIVRPSIKSIRKTGYNHDSNNSSFDQYKSNLYQYKLSNNQIDLRYSINLTSTLVMLELSHTYLEDISLLCNCIQLRYLNLSYNNISCIKSSMVEFKCLEMLILSYNNIKSRDDIKQLNQLINIKYISLVGNPINEIYNYRQVMLLLLMNTTILGLDDYITHDIEKSVNIPVLSKLLNQNYRRFTISALAPIQLRKFQLTPNIYDYRYLPIPSITLVNNLLTKRINILFCQYKAFNPSHIITRTLRKYIIKLRYHKMKPMVSRLISLIRRYLHKRTAKKNLRRTCEELQIQIPLYLQLENLDYSEFVNSKYIYVDPNKPLDMITYFNISYYVTVIQRLYRSYSHKRKMNNAFNNINKFVYKEISRRRKFREYYERYCRSSFIIMKNDLDLVKQIINKLKVKYPVYQNDLCHISFELINHTCLKYYDGSIYFHRIKSFSEEKVSNIHLSNLWNYNCNKFKLLKIKRRGCKLRSSDRLDIKYLVDNPKDVIIPYNLFIIKNVTNIIILYHIYKSIILQNITVYTDKYIILSNKIISIQALYRGYKLRISIHRFLLNRLLIIRSTIAIQRYWKSFYYYKRRMNFLSSLYRNIKLITERDLYIDSWLYYNLCQIKYLPFIPNTIYSYVNEFNYIPIYNNKINKFELTSCMNNYEFFISNSSEDGSILTDIRSIKDKLLYRKGIPKWIGDILLASRTTIRNQSEYVIYNLLTSDVDVSMIRLNPNISYDHEKSISNTYDVSKIYLHIVKLSFSSIEEAIYRFVLLYLCGYDYKTWTSITLLTKEKLKLKLQNQSINLINNYLEIHNTQDITTYKMNDIIDSIKSVSTRPLSSKSTKSVKDKTNRPKSAITKFHTLKEKNPISNILDTTISLCENNFDWLLSCLPNYTSNDIIKFEFFCEILLSYQDNQTNQNKHVFNISRMLYWISRKDDINNSDDFASAYLSLLQQKNNFVNNDNNNIFSIVKGELIDQDRGIERKNVVKILDTYPISNYNERNHKLEKIKDEILLPNHNIVFSKTKNYSRPSSAKSDEINHLIEQNYVSEGINLTKLEKTLENKVLVNNIIKLKQDLYSNYVNKKLLYQQNVIDRKQPDKDLLEKQKEINEMNRANRVNMLISIVKEHKNHKNIMDSNRFISLTSTKELCNFNIKAIKSENKINKTEIIEENRFSAPLIERARLKESIITNKELKLSYNDNNLVSSKISTSRAGYSKYIVDESLSIPSIAKIVKKPPVPPLANKKGISSNRTVNYKARKVNKQSDNEISLNLEEESKNITGDENTYKENPLLSMKKENNAKHLIKVKSSKIIFVDLAKDPDTNNFSEEIGKNTMSPGNDSNNSDLYSSSNLESLSEVSPISKKYEYSSKSIFSDDDIDSENTSESDNESNKD